MKLLTASVETLHQRPRYGFDEDRPRTTVTRINIEAELSLEELELLMKNLYDAFGQEYPSGAPKRAPVHEAELLDDARPRHLLKGGG